MNEKISDSPTSYGRCKPKPPHVRYLDKPQDDAFLYPAGWIPPNYEELPETIPSVNVKHLPAPVIEGQEIYYRNYNDITGDLDIRAVAVLFQGALRWADIQTREMPRRIVGTRDAISEYTHEMIKHHTRAREAWIAARLTFHIGFTPRPDECLKICDDLKLTFQRKIFPYEDFREELWVNNKLDSGWHPRDGANWIIY